MKFIEKHKGLLMGIIVIWALYMIYTYILSDYISSFFAAPATQHVGTDLLDTYNKLQKVTFESDLFQSSAYRSLTDFSTPLAPLPAGRNNPFDVLGRD